MSDDEFVFAPRVTTDGIEKILRDEEHCTKGICTDRVCIWKTPKGHGFMVPNPLTIPSVPAQTLVEILRIIRRLDDRSA
jgi:hypothetical protein